MKVFSFLFFWQKKKNAENTEVCMPEQQLVVMQSVLGG